MQLVKAYSGDLQKLGETYKFVFIGILLAMIGSWSAIQFVTLIVGPIFLALALLELALVIAFVFAKKPALYYAFTFLTGVTLVPLFEKLIQDGSGNVIGLAFSATTIIAGGLTYYATTTKKNFLGMGTFLFWALIGLLVMMVLNLFVGSSLLSLGLSYAAVVLFSFFMIHDTQQVLHTDITPIEAAMGLYLDILNMFVALLRILSDD